MAYIEISNFRYGLDTRKSELTSNPGALVTATDGMINDGGEFEKRKTFMRVALPASVADPVDPETFGLAATSNGFTTFGSDATSMSYPFELWPGGPTVAYQRLQHATGNDMTAVICATSFGGSLLVVADFDGVVGAFYNGTAIADFVAGVVLSSMVQGSAAENRVTIAAALAAVINDPYTGTEQSSQPYFDVSGPVGSDYSLQVTETSADGSIAVAKQSDSTAGGIATSSQGSFRVIAGATGGSVTSVKIKLGVTETELLTNPVSWATDSVVTAAAIATEINGTSSGYTAVASADTVVISRTATGDDKNNYNIQVTASGQMCIGNCSLGISGSSFNIGPITVNGVDIMDVVGHAVINYPGSFTGLDDLLSHATDGVVKRINDHTGTTGYVATSSSHILFISKAVTSSDDLPLTVFVTVDGDGGVTEGTGATFYAKVIPEAVANETYSGMIDYSLEVTCLPVWGTPPYAFSWRRTSATVLRGGWWTQKYIYAVATTAPTTRFYRSDPHNSDFQVQNTFVCDVTDAYNKKISSNELTITFTYTKLF